jgi:glucuronide carrier protein
VPKGLGDGTQLLYAYLSYAVLGLVYSLVNVPYGSLATAMTQVPRERAKLATARGLGAALGGLLLTFIIAPQIQGVSRDKTLSAARAPRSCSRSS